MRAEPKVALAASLPIGIVVAVAFFFLVSNAYFGATPMVLSGSMYVSDAGKAHGGSGYTASYGATLNITGGKGTLQLVFASGPGDHLTTDGYSVTNFAQNSTTLSMLVNGQPVVMRWVANDTVWGGAYTHYYIASTGGSAPPNQIIGQVSPSVFPGLASSWYIELRLR